MFMSKTDSTATSPPKGISRRPESQALAAPDSRVVSQVDAPVTVQAGDLHERHRGNGDAAAGGTELDLLFVVLLMSLLSIKRRSRTLVSSRRLTGGGLSHGP